MESTLPRRVSFFTYSEWDSDRDCMAFIALVDGRRARCLIRSEALVGFAQKDAASPIVAFEENREGVEKLARDLILQGRLDGHELVIGLGDVVAVREAARLPEPAIPTSPAATAQASEPVTPSTPRVDGPVNGRNMQIAPADCKEVWQSICQRQRDAAARELFAQFPDLARRASAESDSFAGQAVPVSAHELNVRRVEASRMASSWTAELLRLQD